MDHHVKPSSAGSQSLRDWTWLRDSTIDEVVKFALVVMPPHPGHVKPSKRMLRERAAAFVARHADDSSEMAERLRQLRCRSNRVSRSPLSFIGVASIK